MWKTKMDGIPNNVAEDFGVGCCLMVKASSRFSWWIFHTGIRCWVEGDNALLSEDWFKNNKFSKSAVFICFPSLALADDHFFTQKKLEDSRMFGWLPSHRLEVWPWPTKFSNPWICCAFLWQGGGRGSGVARLAQYLVASLAWIMTQVTSGLVTSSD